MNLVTPPFATVSSSKLVSLTYSLHHQYLVHPTLLVRITSVVISHMFLFHLDSIYLIRKRQQLLQGLLGHKIREI